MSQRIVDLVRDNSRLFNLLFRHQVYLEGVKAGMNARYKRMLAALYGQFASFAAQSAYDTLDEYSRVKLEQFISRFARAQMTYYNQYTQQLIDDLKSLLAADVDVTKAIYEAATGVTTAKRHAAPVAGDKPSVLGLKRTRGTKAGNAALWETISTTIVPANGFTPLEMLNGFGDSSSRKVIAFLRQGYANGFTPMAVLRSIVGNQDVSFRDGAFSTFLNQNDAILATIIQHSSSITQSAIASIHHNDYQWVSILDSKTTEICRSRDGNIYTYGEGPLPPAHYFCRSKAVSLFEDGQAIDTPSTYYDWLATQPDKVLVDMLGPATAARIMLRNSSAKSISVNDSVIPLTPEQFRSKIGFILM